MKMKLAATVLTLLSLFTTPYIAFAQDDLISREILSGNLGDCPRAKPCSHRISAQDMQISHGIFLFRAASQKLCYPQNIVISKNGSLVFSDILNGTDTSSRNLGAKLNDVFSVYVIQVPTPFPNCDPKGGNLHWAIYR